MERLVAKGSGDRSPSANPSGDPGTLHLTMKSRQVIYRKRYEAKKCQYTDRLLISRCDLGALALALRFPIDMTGCRRVTWGQMFV